MLEKLLRTFYDADKYSEEVRIEALNMLMDKFMDFILPEDSPILTNILISLLKPKRQDKQSKELVKYCKKIVLNKMYENELFKEAVFRLVSRSVIGGLDLLSMYNITGGLSNLLTGDLYSKNTLLKIDLFKFKIFPLFLRIFGRQP